MKQTLSNYSFLLSKHIEKHGIDFIRIALAIVFFWFGILKVVGMSPAQELVEKTVYWFPPEIFVPVLGIAEAAIGIGLIIKKLIPFTILMLLLHMVCTFLPFVILTSTCFDAFPYCPTMEGQYILKNLVLVAGALVVGSRYHLASITAKTNS